MSDAQCTILDDRSARVLRAVIREHIASGDPVASRTVVETSRLDLSPASVRTVMAELEQEGLLSQPHTSAGRVPTPQAYRLYVDRMVRPGRVTAAHALAIEQAFDRRGTEVDDLLEEALHQLSRLSHQVGVVMTPDLKRLVVDRIEFVRLDERRVVAILVARSGVVHDRVIEVAEPVGQDELDRMGRYLSQEVGGRTLSEMRAVLRQRLREERAVYDRLLGRTLDLGSRALEAEVEEGGVIVEGASNLIDTPEFADLEAMRRLLNALEDKKRLIRVLGRVLQGSGVRVLIGDENPIEPMSRCSVVAAGYELDGRVLGTVGVVGPTRMPYDQVMGLVEFLAGCLSRRLSEARN